MANGEAIHERGEVAGLTVDVIDTAGLSARIDARPELRLAMPSLLGVRELDPLIPAEPAGRSTLDRAEAERLAAVFVPTRAYARAVRMLREHRFAVLTGPPEMGKTAIARMVALAKMTDGWEAHECTSPDDLHAAFDPGARRCSSPTTRSAPPSTAPTPPSAGRGRWSGCSARSTIATG